MATVTLKGNPCTTIGELPAVGTQAPDFTAVKTDLSEISLGDCSGRTVILNIFPSVDTSTCAQSVRTFNQKATERPDALVLNISMDLPFALKRFCAAEDIERAEAASVFRSGFATAYGIALTDGPLQGLCARSVVVVGPDGIVRHTQLVDEIADEPDYEAALAAAGDS